MSTKRVQFDPSCKSSSSTTQQPSRRFQRPTSGGPNFDDGVPDDIRQMMGGEPAVMMPVPLQWNSTPNGEQKYMKQMYSTIPDFVRKDLDIEFDNSEAGRGRRFPCRFCGMEFGQTALVHHQAKCKQELESASTDAIRGNERGYLIRNWYSRSHPLKRLERNRHVRDCRYCRAPVPWHLLAQHEDECRSVMYGTAPNGY